MFRSLRRSEPSLSPLSVGVQSYPRRFSVLVFKAAAYLSFRRSELCFVPTWRSEPSPIFASVFRALFCFCLVFIAMFLSLQRSEPLLSPLSISVQSHHCRFSVSMFRAIAYHSFRRSEPYLHSVFRAIICLLLFLLLLLLLLLFSVPSCGFSSTLRVLMSIFRSIHHHFPPFWLLEPLGTLLRTF